MNYELAKKLKEAGFPQRSKQFPIPSDTREYDDGTIEFPTGTPEPVHLPTLSELIEACGEGFYSLIRSPREGLWCAYQVFERLTGLYKTPEEAVANLWLALNKEKV